MPTIGSGEQTAFTRSRRVQTGNYLRAVDRIRSSNTALHSNRKRASQKLYRETNERNSREQSHHQRIVEDSERSAYKCNTDGEMEGVRERKTRTQLNVERFGQRHINNCMRQYVRDGRLGICANNNGTEIVGAARYSKYHVRAFSLF